ncbi:MAG TPA: metallophosphoesterase [Chthonomonadaceae bacterium]|nr:metallophosphoesterase [Chthonomonadaceae bacterium]
MKILAISDVHDAFEAFAPATLPDADLCLVAGDLTNYGIRGEWQLPEGDRALFIAALQGERLGEEWTGTEITRAKRWLEELAQRYPVFWIPGNHDIDVKPDTFGEIPNCACLLDTLRTFGGFRLYGVSMSPCYDAPLLAKQWDYMTADPRVEQAAFDFAPVDIVVSHGPPYDCVDGGMPLWNGERPHLGSPALRAYIERHAPKLVICGHIHEGRGECRIGATRVVNVACSWQVLEL